VWRQVPADVQETASLHGGIVGEAELVGCLAYRTLEEFAADQERHWNDPTWFAEPVLYGFVVSQASVVPFRPCSGWMRFFQVEPSA
jgi:hypothetical protein